MKQLYILATMQVHNLIADRADRLAIGGCTFKNLSCFLNKETVGRPARVRLQAPPLY